MRLTHDAASRLLAAAAALHLAARDGADRWALGDTGAAIVGNPAVQAMVAHHRMLYADLRDPVALLRGTAGATELARYWAYAGGTVPAALPAAHVAPYSILMATSQSLIADEVLAAYDFRRHACLLDAGGGEGAFAIAVAARAPQLRLMVFDLPAVVDRARARLAAAGLAARATCHAGDFFHDALPSGADIVSLVRVLHDHDDACALGLLRAARAALPRGGTLLVAEPLADAPGAEAMGAAYFGFYLLAMGQGRPRTAGELIAMAGTAGFGSIAQVATRMPVQSGLIVARAE